MNSIGFLETLLQYYLPGLDVSSLSETEFINKTAWLLRIRELEKENQVEATLKKLFGRE